MNLPRMITALSAAHAVFEDKHNWEDVRGDVAFDVQRANEVINTACATDLFEQGDQSIVVIITAVILRHQCPDHRVYELAHYLYHLLEEPHMARPKTG